MDIIVTCVPSAFKHGISESNIRHAIRNWQYDDAFENDPGKHLLLGFDSNANLLEILYNVIDEYNIRVFHAMKCRSIFKSLLERGGGNIARFNR